MDNNEKTKKDLDQGKMPSFLLDNINPDWLKQQNSMNKSMGK